MFPRIDYLHWIEGRPEAATYDLGSSDLRGAGSESTGVVPANLSDLPDPPEDVSLESQVANAYGVDPANVLVTAGASLANAIAVGTVLSDHDVGGEDEDESQGTEQVLVEKPGYEPLVETPRAFGARVDRFLRRPEDGYALDPERVEAALTEGPALVTVTNRHNPSGVLTDRDRLAATAEVVADADARLLVDEVYGPFTADARSGPFGGVTAAGVPGAVVTGSLTKFHGLGGLRVGWLVADREFVAAAREVAAHFPALSAPGRTLARRALYNHQRLDERSRDLVRRNAERLAAFVDRRSDLVGTAPAGSTLAFLGHESADGDAVAEAADARDLLVVPGRFFDESDRFRVALGRDTERVESALETLGEVLDEL